MKLYRLHLVHEAGTSAGYRWFPCWTEAQAARRDWLAEHPEDRNGTTIQSIDLLLFRDDVLAALNRYASHPDNG